MKRPSFLLLASLALAGCSDPEVAGGLTMDGLTPARIGMALADLEAAAGPLRVPDNVEAQSCFYVSSAKHPGVLYMMLDGTLQRIDVREGQVATDTGVRVGDPAQKVVEAYKGRVDVAPHKYDYESGAEYLTVFAPDKQRAVRFVTDGKNVTAIQSGNAEPVQFVEGCG